MSRIPLRDVVINARKEPSLEDAQEYSRCHQARVVLHEALSNHTCRPEEHDECEPDGRARALHHHVRRDFGGDVEGEEDGEAVIVLEAVEVEVSLQVIEARITDVRSIEKAQSRG